ncbi:MAG: hypothetical protein DCC57_09210 [Chloroflexi bacterium]|nr:MAG: hypothetical protein DCC57_09210 [Chloroflexota bacterium]
MPVSTPQPNDADGPFTQVDDEQYNNLVELEGQKVVHAAIWEDALADALAGLPGVNDGPAGVDIDLYLKDGVYFELYGVFCYPTLDQDPILDRAALESQLAALIATGLWLEEIAVDEDEALVLVLAQNHRPRLYVQVGAWLLDEWEELPDGAAS